MPGYRLEVPYLILIQPIRFPLFVIDFNGPAMASDAGEPPSLPVQFVRDEIGGRIREISLAMIDDQALLPKVMDVMGVDDSIRALAHGHGKRRGASCPRALRPRSAPPARSAGSARQHPRPACGVPRRPPRRRGESRARVAGPAGPMVCFRLESQARRFRATQRAPCLGSRRWKAPGLDA